MFYKLFHRTRLLPNREDRLNAPAPGPSRLLEVLRFEIVHQAGRVSTWVMFGLFLFPLIGVTTDDLVDAQRGEILYNSALHIARHGAVMGTVALLVLAAVAGDAATRDIRTGLEPLVRATSVDRRSLVVGRFLGAFAVAALLVAAVPLAHLLAPLTRPELGPEVLGPLRPALHLQTLFLILLPNAFFATALFFTLATRLRHGLGSWLGVALLFVAVQFTHSYVGDVLGRWDLAQVLDPTGMNVLDLMFRTGSPEDLAARSAASPALLWNRVIWLAVAGVILAFGLRRDPRPASGPKWRGILASARRRQPVLPPPTFHPPPGPVSPPRARGTFGLRGRVRQFVAIVRDSLREVAPPWTWVVAPLLVVGQAAVTLSGLAVAANGTPVLPTTRLVLATLGPVAGDAPPPVILAAVLLPILLAGELVWRERDANAAPLADTTPVPDALWFAGKVAGLWLALAGMVSLLALGGIAAQVRLGWFDFELGLYAQVLGLRFLRLTAFGLFAVAAHVLVNQKHIGTLVVLLLIAPLIGELFGFEHPLLLTSWSPPLHLSAMTGVGPFLAPILWFDLYWGAAALVVACIARLFWIRGLEAGRRLRTARRRLRGTAAAALSGSLALVALTGGFVFYNTNLLNPYRTSGERTAAAAEYERRYGAWRDAPRPDLVATDVRVELHPSEGRATVEGTHHLVNRTDRPIDTVHVATSLKVDTTLVELDRGAHVAQRDDELGHRILVLDTPLEPGDSLRMRWAVTHDPRGFSANGASTEVVDNGTWVVMADWIPQLGYRRDRELSDPADRRAQGLPPRPALPAFDDAAAPFDDHGREQLLLSVTVGTDAGETAVAPGRLVRNWSEGGRDYFEYRTDAPIGTGYALFSADYAIRRSHWAGVDIEVLHHPPHTANVDRMIRGMEASLEQLTERFGPFPHDVLKMVEYPAPGGSLHAASGMIWYREMFSHFDPSRDPRGVDMPFAVTAHEVAHQFQPVPAFMEGAILLSESFAWYAAMGVIEAELGTDHLRGFLDYMRRAYLTPRARADVPLLRAQDSFQGYRKGPFAMYALREYVGQERVDAAWRTLRDRRPPDGGAPYATSLELYRELQAVTPDSLHALLGDLLERNTFWELSATAASAAPTGDGRWRVDLEVHARKVVVDTAGVETEIPMDDPVEIGAYAGGEDGPERVLYRTIHRIRSGPQTLSITVPERPARAGIDPRHLLIDVRPDDNMLRPADEGGR